LADDEIQIWNLKLRIEEAAAETSACNDSDRYYSRCESISVEKEDPLQILDG
jgi:hypothetical protein